MQKKENWEEKWGVEFDRLWIIGNTKEDFKRFIRTQIRKAEKREYDKGFIDGAHATGEQAKEIEAIKVAETRQEERKKIIGEVEKNLERIILYHFGKKLVGDKGEKIGAKYVCQEILVKLQEVKERKRSQT